MANMSYVRFENTYNDLLDCYHTIEQGYLDDLSKSEQGYYKRLFSVCENIVDRGEYEFDDDSLDESVNKKNKKNKKNKSMNEKQIISVLKKLEEAVDSKSKRVVLNKKKPTNKVVMKESVMQAIMDILNSTQHFGTWSSGGLNMTYGEVAHAVCWFFGVGGTTTLLYLGTDKIISAIKSVPSKFNKIVQAFKAIKSGNAEKLEEMGVNLKKAKEQLQQREQTQNSITTESRKRRRK